MSLVRVFHSPQSRSQKDNTKIPPVDFFSISEKKEEKNKEKSICKVPRSLLSSWFDQSNGHL